MNIYDKLVDAEAVRAWAIEQAGYVLDSTTGNFTPSEYAAELIRIAGQIVGYVAGDMKSDAAKTAELKVSVGKPDRLREVIQKAVGGVIPPDITFPAADGCVVPHVATTLSADERQRLAECAVPHTDGNPGILQTT